jgi:transposase
MDGLSGLVRGELSLDPQAGDLYLFLNRRRDLIKLLFFDRGGYCLFAKRLEKGTFSIAIDAAAGVAHIELSAKELASLLSDARIVQKAARAA